MISISGSREAGCREWWILGSEEAVNWEVGQRLDGYYQGLASEGGRLRIQKPGEDW